ncbi:hypothetical protein QU600_000998 [Orientia tsutsugamushi]|uniref:hypothetical protein n=1 Tax=Orientia tsutsugamushi TaxID=784 RepID=UPI00315CE28E
MTTDNKHINDKHSDTKKDPGFINQLKLILQQLKALYLTLKLLIENNKQEKTKDLEKLAALLAQLHEDLESQINKHSNDVSKTQEQSNEQNNNKQKESSNVDNSCSVTSPTTATSSKQTQNVPPPPPPPPPPPLPPLTSRVQKEKDVTSSKKKQQKEDDPIKPVNKPSLQELLEGKKKLKPPAEREENKDPGKGNTDPFLSELKNKLISRRSGITGKIDKKAPENTKSPKLDGIAGRLSQAIPYVPNDKNDNGRTKPVVPPKPSFADQVTSKSNQSKNNSRDR